MLILGIDTSGRQGSVALLTAQGEELVTLDLSTISGGQYSELLVPTVAELLVRHGFEKSSINLIAVASGPGSFTGLRIAIATVKGLAEAFATPVVAVSVLEAIALAAGSQGRIVAAMDAQRSEVFFGDYDVTVEALIPAQMTCEGITTFAGFTSLFGADNPSQKVFTSDELLAARFREASMDAVLLTRPSAESIARIAHRKFLSGVRADVATLDANYLRRSDAEILIAPKNGATSR